jgi:hypothetical protein
MGALSWNSTGFLGESDEIQAGSYLSGNLAACIAGKFNKDGLTPCP